MSRETLPLDYFCDVAIQAAREAGQFIQGVDRKIIQRRYKDAGSSSASQVVTEVDFRSEAIIREHLRESCEQWDIAFVGEESSQDPGGDNAERLSKSHFWCVDPLDGTLPFVEGTAGYAVSIALVEQSGTPLIGVVYDPVSATLLHAVKSQGAFRNMSAITPAESAPGCLKVFADASFSEQANYDEVVAVLNACASKRGLAEVELVYGNGAVKNACQVLEHSAACYIKLPKPEEGGGSIWDFAATACLLREAGGWASNIYGKPLDLNRPESTYMNHQGVLFASNEQLARDLIDSLPGKLHGTRQLRSH